MIYRLMSVLVFIYKRLDSIAFDSQADCDNFLFTGAFSVIACDS